MAGAMALFLRAMSQRSGVLVHPIVGMPTAAQWVAFDAQGLPAVSDVLRQRLLCWPHVVAALVVLVVLVAPVAQVAQVLGGGVQAGRRDCRAPGAPLRAPALRTPGEPGPGRLKPEPARGLGCRGDNDSMRRVRLPSRPLLLGCAQA
jgi:hypothetical protein